MKEEDYESRTLKNVETSEATLIFFSGSMDEGTKYILHCCRKMDKSCLLIDLRGKDKLKIRPWLRKRAVDKLNIAGPRESNAPGIYKEVLDFLRYSDL